MVGRGGRWALSSSEDTPEASESLPAASRTSDRLGFQGGATVRAVGSAHRFESGSELGFPHSPEGLVPTPCGAAAAGSADCACSFGQEADSRSMFAGGTPNSQGPRAEGQKSKRQQSRHTSLQVGVSSPKWALRPLSRAKARPPSSNRHPWSGLHLQHARKSHGSRKLDASVWETPHGSFRAQARRARQATPPASVYAKNHSKAPTKSAKAWR